LLKPIKPSELNERLEKSVEERKRKQTETSETGAVLAKAPGFINAAWAKPFYLLCGELQLRLQAGEAAAVEKKLARCAL
jgi:hypothetical protein